MCDAGRKWLSVSRSVTFAALLYSTMPTAPRCRTSKPFCARPIPAPRWQTTTLPAKAPSGVAFAQNGSLYGASAALTIGVGAERPAVSDVPVSVSVLSPAVTVTEFRKARFAVLAATVVVHGSRCPTVSAPGPSLPAEAATNTPALYASRNAIDTASLYGLFPPPIEKLITLTPSWIAFWTAAAESLEKQPSSPQTLYIITCARGAIPEIVPRETPKMLAATPRFPAAVLDVCEPWPLSYRA